MTENWFEGYRTIKDEFNLIGAIGEVEYIWIKGSLLQILWFISLGNSIPIAIDLTILDFEISRRIIYSLSMIRVT